MSDTQSDPTQDAKSEPAPDAQAEAQAEAQPEAATPEITVQPPTPPTKKPDPWEI